MKKAIEEIEREWGEGKEKRRGWWNEKCKMKKKEVRRELREWRRKGGEDEKYKRSKQEYKDLCERRKREENAR